MFWDAEPANSTYMSRTRATSLQMQGTFSVQKEVETVEVPKGIYLLASYFRMAK